MRRHITHLTTLFAIACLISACGFQLRGVGSNTVSIPAEWKSMTLITGNPNSELSREVVSRFSANGVEWTDRKSASYQLRLGGERFQQRNLSLNAEARAAEFELTMRTRFTVVAKGGEEIIPETEASVVKQMENDPRNVVGKAEEVRLLKSEMRAELAQQIMRRIGFFAAGSQAGSQADSATQQPAADTSANEG